MTDRKTGTVCEAMEVLRIRAKMNWFQATTKQNMPVAISPGLETGRMMRMKACSRLQPSTSAALSRFLGTVEGMRWINRLANKVFAGLVNLLYRGNITDEATAYKAFRREVLDGMTFRCRRYDFCPEVTAKVLKRGYKIKEVPVFYRARTREEGKKIGWWDGVQCIWALVRERFTR